MARIRQRTTGRLVVDQDTAKAAILDTCRRPVATAHAGPSGFGLVPRIAGAASQEDAGGPCHAVVFADGMGQPQADAARGEERTEHRFLPGQVGSVAHHLEGALVRPQW